MNEFSKYVDVLIQAPLAVIMVIFIYLTFKFNSNLILKVSEQQNSVIDKVTKALNEAIKIIKQIKRK